MTGVSVSTLEQLTKVRAHTGRTLRASDFSVLKKAMGYLVCGPIGSGDPERSRCAHAADELGNQYHARFQRCTVPP